MSRRSFSDEENSSEETPWHEENSSSSVKSDSTDEISDPVLVDEEDFTQPSDLDFRAYLEPKVLNLMNEFADAEMFLIDGDSLLMELILDKNLDWDYSGQFLHLVYICERYLHFFVRKGGVFQLVFFQDFEHLWKSNPSLNLARQALKVHLAENIPNAVLGKFKNPLDPNFEKYVHEFCPSFVLLSDGEFLSQASSRPFSIPNKAVKIFVCHLRRCLELGLNCAFTSGIEFGTSTLTGYHVSSCDVVNVCPLPLAEVFDELCCSNGNSQTEVEKSVDDMLKYIQQASVPLAMKYCSNERQLDGRLFLYMASASVYLKLFSGHGLTVSQLDLIRVVLVHGVLLTELPLKYRALSLDDCDEFEMPDVQQNFLQCLTKIQIILCEFLKRHFVLPEESDLSWSRICDIWDGRLLFVTFSLLLSEKRNGKNSSLSESSKKKYISLINSVSSLSNESIEPFPILVGELGGGGKRPAERLLAGEPGDFLKNGDCQIKSPETSKLKKEGLIKMECPLLNQYAGEILNTTSIEKLDLDDPAVAALVVSGKDFDERYHWHSGKPLSDDYDRTKTDQYKGKDKFALRVKAKHATFMRKYGESLAGETNSNKAIVVEKTSKREKKAKKKSKKSQQIIEGIEKKKQDDAGRKEVQTWERKRKHARSLVDQGKYDDAFREVVGFIENASVKKTIIDALLMKAMICWEKWKLVCENSVNKGKDTHDAEESFLTIRELVQNYAKDLKGKDKITLGEYLVGLGFADIAVKMNLIDKSDQSSKFSLGMSSSRFQLHSIGHYLRRETRNDPDQRVDSFIPESWQRELLNAVDNKQSALIVAPTSSGKTFASYYCMERVLKEDNEGVVVYVSPTKALVNQVAATCYARYNTKRMPPGKSVYGVFTRDYRTNALNSQILVTVPQCLEILLLSPARQDWVAKIKYVVFDEVHCIGSEIGAEYWEHLLLLIRSPFLALSATIRNPHDLHTWLQKAESGKRKRDLKNKTVRPNSPKSYEVALVTYSERYNDLEKFSYVAPRRDPTRGVIGRPQLKPIHPCSMLTVRQLKQTTTFPAHVSLSPKETLALYDAMAGAWPEKDEMQSLKPEIYFKETAFISKPNAKLYEASLKEELMTWMTDCQRVERVISGLGGEVVASSRQPVKTKRVGNWYVIGEFYTLLQELAKNDQLPAIFFSFDRHLCERLTADTVEYLCDKETRIQSHPSVERRTKKQEKMALKLAKLERRCRDSVEEEELLRKTCSVGHSGWHNQRKQNSGEINCFLFDNPPLESCTFAGVGMLDRKDGEEIVRKLQRKICKTQNLSLFEEGLRRGVSYHHAGLSAPLRGIVEMLFRKKFVRVVFATGTLALGIHMPCKTVVFAGDSVFLNTLQYHQISGRAGRRGFDHIGNVIFLGIPQPKVQRLMTVNLPRIIGNFPLNVSLVLRLLLLVSKVNDPERARDMVLTLLQNPLICMDQPELDLQLKHHFLFSVELLIRQGLLDQKGNPQGLAGLATHLHYHEPANLVLVALLEQGLFHEFCKGERRNEVDNTTEEVIGGDLGLVDERSALKNFVMVYKIDGYKSGYDPVSFLESVKKTEIDKLKEDRKTKVHVALTCIMKKTDPATGYTEERENSFWVNNQVNLEGTNLDEIYAGDKFSKDFLKSLLVVLSYLFARRPLHSFILNRPRSTSKVILEDLPPKFKEGLEKYNNTVHGVFDLYLRTVASHVYDKMGEDITLPLSEIEFIRSAKRTLDSAVSTESGPTLEKALEELSVPYKACSAFAALSGNTDHRLYSSEDLISNIRYQVYTDIKVVPILHADSPLNAYVVDFFNHGNRKALIHENGIMHGEVFALLKDFFLVIKAIKVSLTELGPEEDDVIAAFIQLVEEYKTVFNEAFKCEI